MRAGREAGGVGNPERSRPRKALKLRGDVDDFTTGWRPQQDGAVSFKGLLDSALIRSRCYRRR